jgi:heavy metal translocating P-type ATPase
MGSRSAPLASRPAAATVAGNLLAGHDGPEGHPVADRPESRALLRIGLVALAAAAVWLRVWEPFPRLSVIGLTATLVGGHPIFREALSSLRARRMTMELSMTIAIAAALVIGESFTALVITLFVLIAEVLEGLTVGRGRRAIKDLLDVLPRQAFVRRGDGARAMRVAEIAPGDVVVVRPGARLPVDGIVVAGHSFVDQSTITGESLPAEKVPGAQVYAGTLNQSGALDVRTTRIGRETAFGKIVEAVEVAERSRAPVQSVADQLAGYLVYFAIGCAALTFLITRDVRATISVVIVAGACGIAAGTPLAILGAIGQAARRGAIVKGGLYLETLSQVDTVVLDKTGTLTYGDPEVVAIHAVPGATPQDVLAAAAIAERPSEHPVGKAILKKAVEMALPVIEPERFASVVGQGVVCTIDREDIVVGCRELLAAHNVHVTPCGIATHGSSEIHVARHGRYLGDLHVADVVRSEAKDAVTDLRRLGLRLILLTGDTETVARAVGHELEIDEVEAGLLPGEKLARIEALLAEDRTVAMIGDGVNDAPALMRASAGVAMGSGTDVARESAPVVLLGNDLGAFADTLRIARRCRRIVMANFAGTLAVDAVGVSLAAVGVLGPLLAAFVHVASELAFILNSARLLPAASRSAGTGPASERQERSNAATRRCPGPADEPRASATELP